MCWLFEKGILDSRLKFYTIVVFHPLYFMFSSIEQ